MKKGINQLRTKSIHAAISPADGYRISIMSRHTLNDGITPDHLITNKTFNIWMKDLAPPDLLIGDYYKRGLPWEEFEKRYLEFLHSNERKEKILELIEMAKRQTITLLCAEDTPEHCHRRLVAEECHKLNPKLAVVIK
jgi:uncharacterized protein YeaO (DUF488 family)